MRWTVTHFREVLHAYAGEDLLNGFDFSPHAHQYILGAAVKHAGLAAERKVKALEATSKARREAARRALAARWPLGALSKVSKGQPRSKSTNIMLENILQMPNTAEGDIELSDDEFVVLLRRIFGLPICDAKGWLEMVPLEDEAQEDENNEASAEGDDDDTLSRISSSSATSSSLSSTSSSLSSSTDHSTLSTDGGDGADNFASNLTTRITCRPARCAMHHRPRLTFGRSLVTQFETGCPASVWMHSSITHSRLNTWPQRPSTDMNTSLESLRCLHAQQV